MNWEIDWRLGNLNKAEKLIQIRLKIGKSQPVPGQAAYYQGPWELDQGRINIARGNIIAFNKMEIMHELCRQVGYFFENVL